jgi:hypothetical protein
VLPQMRREMLDPIVRWYRRMKILMKMLVIELKVMVEVTTRF